MLEAEAGDIERKTWFVVAHFEGFDKKKMAPDTSGVFCALLATDRAAADHSTLVSTFWIHAVVDNVFLLQERERAYSKWFNRYIDSGDIIAFSLHLATPQSSRGPSLALQYLLTYTVAILMILEQTERQENLIRSRSFLRTFDEKTLALSTSIRAPGIFGQTSYIWRDRNCLSILMEKILALSTLHASSKSFEQTLTFDEVDSF